MRRLPAGLLTALWLLAGLAGVRAQPASGAVLSLGGDWSFRFARTPEEAGGLARFFEPSFDASGFSTIPVPSNWALLGYEEPLYGKLKAAGEGFYLRRFRAPDGLAAKRVLLHFDGVWSSAEVWLNAVPLGRHDSGFTGFAFDVSDVLKSGENRLAVRVRQLTRDYLFDANDDWSLGGIFRDVWLEAMPRQRYIARVETSTTFDGQFQNADLNIRALVMQARGGSPRGDYELRMTLTGPAGESVQHAAVAIPGHPNTGRDTPVTMRVRSPRPWTAETPALYRLRVDLVEDGNVVHSLSHAVGFREVSTKGGILRVNGRPVKLRGVCRHDEHPDVGIATRREHWLEDIRLMKVANINAVRTVHYPPAAGFIDLCDEMGLWVIEECPMGYGGDLGSDPSFVASGLLRAYETVTRDRNHPSVIIWSVGNENPLTAMHLATMRAVKGWDPTRPVLLPWHPEQWLPPEVDILAPHYPTAAGAETLTAAAGRPVVATEYTHALGEDTFGGLEDCWRALTSHPAGAGGTIWMWQDQGLRIHDRSAGDGQPRYLLNPEGIDGIVRSDRSPQRDYWETKAVYAPVGIPVASLPFRAGQAAVRVPVSNEFDFTDLATVAIQWKLMAGDRALASGSARATAAPHTTASFNLPLDQIRRAEPDVPYYAHVSFLRGDGSEISRRSVELLPEAPAIPAVREQAAGAVRVRQGSTVSVAAAGSVYEFDPHAGLLAKAILRGGVAITALRPTIWRMPSPTEREIYRRAGLGESKLADLDRYAMQVTNWRISQGRGEVTIDAAAEHRVNERNKFSVGYRYRVRADGSLDVQYTIRPAVEAPWIPEAGMIIETTSSLDHLRWLGLGPLDAYPNLKAAAIFGLWSARSGTEFARGTKAGVRWAELADSSQTGFRVSGCGYVRLEAPGRLRILTAVEGRPSKYRRPDPPVYRLELGPATVIRGAFLLAPGGR